MANTNLRPRGCAGGRPTALEQEWCALEAVERAVVERDMELCYPEVNGKVGMGVVWAPGI